MLERAIQQKELRLIAAQQRSLGFPQKIRTTYSTIVIIAKLSGAET